MLDKAKILNKVYQVVKGVAPRYADESLAAAKASVPVVQPKFYGYDKATGASRKTNTPERFGELRQEAHQTAMGDAAKGALHTASSIRWGHIWRENRVTKNMYDRITPYIDEIKETLDPRTIRRANKMIKAEQRGPFLEDLSTGNMNSSNVRRTSKHYEMDTRYLQDEAPELFEHAMKRQGWNLDGTGPLDKLKPMLIRPKPSAGNANWQDIQKDENVKFIQYLLHQGKKNKLSLEEVQKWFDDDWSDFIVGQIMKKNNGTRGRPLWTREMTIKSLKMNGGMPRTQIKNGKLYIDQVIMSSDQTMGFAPVSMEVGRNGQIKALVHDVWDNGTPGSPLWQMWTGNQQNLVLSHSKVFNLEPSILNLRKTEMWGKVQAKIKRTVKNPERAGQGKDIVEAAKIQYNGDHQAMSDELLARLETYLNYQVKHNGKSPLRALDEVSQILGSGDTRKVDKKWLQEIMSNDDMVAVDADASIIIAGARAKADKFKANKKPYNKEQLKDMNLNQKITTSMSKTESKALKETMSFFKKMANEELSNEAVQAFIDRRVMPIAFGGALAGSGYTIYKKSQE